MVAQLDTLLNYEVTVRKVATVSVSEIVPEGESAATPLTPSVAVLDKKSTRKTVTDGKLSTEEIPDLRQDIADLLSFYSTCETKVSVNGNQRLSWFSLISHLFILLIKTTHLQIQDYMSTASKLFQKLKLRVPTDVPENEIDLDKLKAKLNNLLALNGGLSMTGVSSLS